MAKTKKASLSGRSIFPKTLYVYRRRDGDEVYYIAAESIDTLDEDDTEFVASYELRDVSRLVVTRELKQP